MWSMWRNLVVLWLVICIIRAASAKTVHVPDSRLIEALKDPGVELIVLTAPVYDIGDEFQPYLKGPLPINRNVTVTGLPGQSPVLDLKFQQDVLSLCSSCSITFENMSLSQERHGLGAEVDIIRGTLQSGAKAKPGTLVRMRNVNRVRVACVPADLTVQEMQEVPASKYVTGAAVQKLEFVDYSFLGVPYPQSVRALEYTGDTPLTPSEEGGMFGGYSLDLKNVTYVCRHFVNTDCLKRKSQDVCVHDILYEMSDEELLQQPTAAKTSVSPVLIAVPVVLGVLLLAGLLAGFLWLRRRKRKQQQQGQQPPPDQLQSAEQDSKNPPSVTGRSTAVTAASVCVTSDDSAMEAGLLSNSAASSNLASQRTNWQKPRSNWKGWRLYGTSTTPMIGAANSPIEIGELLGAGSFGRVYKGRWANMDVAVKIIEHTSDASSLVENEVQLQLFFTNSPYIVRAYHYESYTRPRSTSRVGSASRSSQRRALAAAALQRRPSQMSEALSSDSFQLQSACTSSPSGVAMRVGSGTGDAAAGMGVPNSNLDSDSSNALVSPPASAEQADSSSCSLQKLRPEAVCPIAPAVAVSTGPGSSSSGGPGLSAGSDQHQQRDQLQQVHQQQQQPPPRQALARLGSVPGSAGSALRALAEDAQLCLTEESQENLATVDSSVDDSSLCSQSTNAQSHTSFDVCKAETWIVLELCDCGNLYEVAADWNPQMEGDQQMLERLLLLRDAACGLEVLHGANVVHGDLNARNVLVSSSSISPLGMVAKLSDLGLSRVIKQHQTHRTTNTVGTMSHMPPELLRSGYMSSAVDIYSFAIMMWELYTGQIAFRKVHYAQFFETVVLRNVRPFIPTAMPNDYRLLMEHCWASNPSDRPPVNKVIQCLDILIADRQARITAAAAGGTSGSGSEKQQQQQQQQPDAAEEPGAAGGPSEAAAAPDAGGGNNQQASSAATQLLGILGPVPAQQNRPVVAVPPRQSSCPESGEVPGAAAHNINKRVLPDAAFAAAAAASRSEPLSYLAGVAAADPAGDATAAGVSAAGILAAAPRAAGVPREQAAASPGASGALGSSLVCQEDYEVSNHMNWFV